MEFLISDSNVRIKIFSKMCKADLYIFEKLKKFIIKIKHLTQMRKYIESVEKIIENISS